MEQFGSGGSAQPTVAPTAAGRGTVLTGAATSPAGVELSREQKVAEAKANGTFNQIRDSFNRQALAAGHPQQMDEEGNIVAREPTMTERMFQFGLATGGSTDMLPVSQTTPQQRALQMGAMDRARGQLAFQKAGQAVGDKLAEQAAANAPVTRQLTPDTTKIVGGKEVTVPGVRAAFKNGQTVGFSEPVQEGRVGMVFDEASGKMVPIKDRLDEMRKRQGEQSGPVSGLLEAMRRATK